MAYGSIKVDNVIYTKGGVDTTITVSGIVDSLSGAISVTGAISGASVSAATGTFTTLSGDTTAGTTATFTSGVFTTFSGTTVNVVSGVFASGAVALPSVSVGTSSNGLYSPGTNQVGISTSGNGRLTVDSAGNVSVDGSTVYIDAANNRIGLGTASPTSLLHLVTSSSSGSSNTDGVRINSGGNVAINIGSNSTTGYGWIQSANWGTGYISTAINPNGGNVGIGTTSPTNTAGFQQQLQLTGNLPCISIDNTGTGARKYSLGVNSLGALAVWDNTASDYRMYVDSAGNVGIGTSSPIAALHVSNGGAAGIEISPLTAFNGPNIQAYNRSSSAYVPLDFSASSFFWYISGNQKMQLDSSGRLLVGTSSARTPLTHSPSLQVEGVGYAPSTISVIGNSNDINGSYIFIGKSRGTSVGSNTIVQSGDEIGGLDFIATDGTQALRAARITAHVDGTPGTNDMPGRLLFYTTADGAASPTERMQIGNAGVINTYTATGDSLNIRNAAAAGTATGLIYGLYSATSTSNGTVSFTVWSNGNVVNTNGSYGTISDAKLKENIVDANSQWDDIKSLQVRNYNFKEGQTHTQIGLVAQEVELISPGLVSESPDRDAEGNDLGTVTKSVNLSVLYMKAVKALQEAMERIETLETKVAALESR